MRSYKIPYNKSPEEKMAIATSTITFSQNLIQRQKKGWRLERHRWLFIRKKISFPRGLLEIAIHMPFFSHRWYGQQSTISQQRKLELQKLAYVNFSILPCNSIVHLDFMYFEAMILDLGLLFSWQIIYFIFIQEYFSLFLYL